MEVGDGCCAAVLLWVRLVCRDAEIRLRHPHRHDLAMVQPNPWPHHVMPHAICQGHDRNRHQDNTPPAAPDRGHRFQAGAVHILRKLRQIRFRFVQTAALGEALQPALLVRTCCSAEICTAGRPSASVLQPSLRFQLSPSSPGTAGNARIRLCSAGKRRLKVELRSAPRKLGLDRWCSA